MTDNTIIKTLTIIQVSIISIFVYLNIDYVIFGLYIALMIIDFITGIIKGIINKDLSSKTATIGFASKFLMVLLIFSVGITGKMVNFENMSVVLSWIFSALAFAELYSIVGNIVEIRTGQKIKEFDAITLVIKKILLIIRKNLEKIDKKTDTVLEDILINDKKENKKN